MYSDEGVEEIVCPWNLTGEDAKHISRLQALRSSGLVNMATELQYGLTEIWPEDGMETYKWATERYPEYYFSGNWTSVDPSYLE